MSIESRSTDALHGRWLLALALALGACGEEEAAGPAAAARGRTSTTVAKRDVPLYIEAVGALDGYVNADIRARVRGYLRTQDYKDGSPVKAGQLLFTIEPTEYAAARDVGEGRPRARARWRSARNQHPARARPGSASRPA